MSGIHLNSPRYRVVFGDPEDETTWTEVEVQAITRDLQQAESLFVRHKWGKPADQPFRLTAASAYFALKRSGRIEGTWDDFENGYLEVGVAGVDAVDPTQPAPEVDS
jgi:hypothetical protein